MKWYDNRYYSIDANELRLDRKMKLYKMPRYYLIDNFTGQVIMYDLSQEGVDFFYNTNKLHLVYRK